MNKTRFHIEVDTEDGLYPEEREAKTMSRYDPQANGFNSLDDFNRWRT